jgi:hypothetical protein
VPYIGQISVIMVVGMVMVIVVSIIQQDIYFGTGYTFSGGFIYL